MDLLYNKETVESIYKSNKKMRLRRNVGKMVIDHKAMVVGYIKNVWFYNTYITNIFSLKNLIHKYRVTYDSLNQIFIVYQEKIKSPTCTLEFLRVVSTTMTQMKILPS